MQTLIVSGGTRLEGEIAVHGSKNAALPILAATLLVDAPVRLVNLPRLLDVENMLRILTGVGCTVVREGDAAVIDARTADTCVLPEHTSKELRSSIFLLGSVLSRFGRAVAAYPGGCDIGNRPIDLHLSGLMRLGAAIHEDGGRIVCLLLTAIIEGISRKKLNPKYEGYVHTAGMVLLLALMLFITFHDVFVLFTGGST